MQIPPTCIHTHSLSMHMCMYIQLYIRRKKEYIPELFLYSFFLFNKTVQFYQNITKLTSILFERGLNQNRKKKKKVAVPVCFLLPFCITHTFNNPGFHCLQALSPTPLRYNNNLKKDVNKFSMAVNECEDQLCLLLGCLQEKKKILI